MMDTYLLLLKQNEGQEKVLANHCVYFRWTYLYKSESKKLKPMDIKCNHTALENRLDPQNQDFKEVFSEKTGLVYVIKRDQNYFYYTSYCIKC